MKNHIKPLSPLATIVATSHYHPYSKKKQETYQKPHEKAHEEPRESLIHDENASSHLLPKKSPSNLLPSEAGEAPSHMAGFHLGRSSAGKFFTEISVDDNPW